MLEVLACAVMALWLQSCSITPCLCTLQWYNLYSTLVLHCLSASDFSTRALNCNDFTPFPTSETLNHHKNVIFHSYRKFISLKISVSGGGGGDIAGSIGAESRSRVLWGLQLLDGKCWFLKSGLSLWGIWTQVQKEERGTKATTGKKACLGFCTIAEFSKT